MERMTRRSDGRGRRGARTAAAAGALAVVAILGAGAWRQVDGDFAHFYRSVDFAHPAGFFSDPNVLGPSDLGLAYWAGSGPLGVRLGPIHPGDVVKLKLRAESGSCTLAVRVGEARIATLSVNDVWVQHEVVSPRGGDSLVLEPSGASPCPVHISRLTVSNVAGHADGVFALYLRHAVPAGAAARGPAAWLCLAPPLLLVLLTVWRRRTGAADLPAAVAGAAADLVPAAAVVAAGEVLLAAEALRLVMPPRTFLALLVLPAAAIEAVRCRSTVRRAAAGALRALGSAVAGRGGRPGSPSPWMRLRAILAPAAASAGRALERAAAAGVDTVTAVAAARGGLAGRRLAVSCAGFGVVLAALTALFAALVVQDFGAPLSGPGDLSLWEHQNSYVARNLSFEPLPRLDLRNDQLFYPYGGNNVFQPWVFEMHLAASAATHAFGQWGWCQLYFLISVAVTALGAFLLLVREHGAWRAGAVAVAVSFCNYYAIGKFAGQLAVALVHWTVLGVVADAVIARRLVERRRLSARLLLARSFLLFACLGLDLGYVAGLGLTSALLTGALAAVVACDRGGWRAAGIRREVAATFGDLAASAREHRLQVVLLGAATAAAAFLYVPLVLQVAAAAREFSFAGMANAYWWANPLRLLQPILPGFNPVSHGALFHDKPEGAFAASPGLAVVLAALAGVVSGRKRLLAALPAGVMLALLLSYHPVELGLVRVLPWFSFARVTGRFTVVYPALLSALALMAPPDLRRWRGRVVAAGLVGLLAVEAVTAYRAYLIKEWRFPRPTPEVAALMAAVRAAPGEAVLDWPFCLAGGNGVGTGLLCRYYQRQCGIGSLQWMHGKKVVGSYFGRLHPSQIKPYVAAGWPRLFLPDDRSPFRAQRQRRDFEPDEWEFMERFVRLGDFSGVLLHTDRLPAATVAGFHARFGPPAAAATTVFGRVEFIPKPTSWRAETDVAAARRLVLPVLLPLLAPERPVAMGSPSTDEFLGPGWGAVWKGRRTSEARAVELRFRSEAMGACRLRLLGGTFTTQRVKVRVNGVEVGEWRHDGGALRVLEAAIPEGVLQRDNVVRFELPDARTPRSLGLNDDDRLLGLTVEWFRLDPAGR